LSLPSPDIDFATDGVICEGSNVTFISNSSSPGNISSFDWNFGDLSAHGSGSTTQHAFVAGTYNVTLRITATNGCFNTVNRATTQFAAPVANFTLPAPSLVCTNQKYTFTNTSSFDPSSNVSWQWNINGSPAATGKDLITGFSSVATQAISLTASLPGCLSQSNQNFVVQQPGPLVDYVVANGCKDIALQFTNLTNPAGLSFLWTFGDGNTSNQINASNIYLSTGNYTTTLTASSPNGCNNFQSKPLTVYSLPQPDFSVGAPPFSCNNTATPFQNNTPVLTDSNITGWQWQFNDAAAGTSTSQSPSYIFSAPGTFNVTLQASSDAGCMKAITKPVIISPSPTADFSVGPSCVNLPTKFTDLSSGSIVSRSWQIGPATFTSQNPSYTFASPGTFPATLTVNGANGCSAVKASNVLVPVPPTLSFTNSILCVGKDGVFTDVTSSPQDIAVAWTWNFDGNSVTGNPASYNFPSTGTFNVKMTTTHQSNCRYTLAKNISVNPTPVANFIASPDRGSPPLTVQFTNTSQQAASYAWKFYDKVLATSTAASPAYTFTSLGNYSAELTATNSVGCSDVKTFPIVVLVPAIDLALTDFSLVPDPATTNLRSVVTIRNNSNVAVSFADVSLILSNKAAVNETVQINLDPGRSVTKMLSFTVPADINSFLCAEIISEQDARPSDNKQCINFEANDYFFDPYPNPAVGPLQLDWIAVAAGPTRVIIYESMGRKVFDWQTNSIVGLNRATVDLALFQAGVYYVTIETGKSRKTTRLVRQ
jgi:PKD repeat protein